MKEEKRLLVRWAKTTETIQRLQNEIREYKELINDSRDLTGIAMDGLPHGSTPGNPTESKALKALKLEDTYEDYIIALKQKIDEEIDVHQRVETVLDNYPDTHRAIITLRYVNDLEWFDVADRMFYSPSWCRKMHDEVLNDLKSGNK